MGSAFKDSKGREWTLQITAPLIDAVREVDPKFLLDNPEAGDNTANRLAADSGLLCHVIYVLCRKQRESLGVTLDEFYVDALGTGELIEAAAAALEAAIENFTPPKKRAFIKAVATKQRAVEDLAIAKVTARISDPDLEAKISAAMDAQLDSILAQMIRPSNATG